MFLEPADSSLVGLGVMVIHENNKTHKQTASDHLVKMLHGELLYEQVLFLSSRVCGK